MHRALPSIVRMSAWPRRPALAALAVLAMGVAMSAAPEAQAAEPECRLRSAAGPAPLLVELYTSEGCSSCPPADRWLSTLKGRADVLALGFHVNYWDSLGWRDRFATEATTERQKSHRTAWGARQTYTPQVVVAGRDWPRWSAGLPARNSEVAPVALELERQGPRTRVRIAPVRSGTTTARLAGWWAVLEDGHASRVRTGENAGEHLRHDHVVRDYRPVPAWSAERGAEYLLDLGPPDPAHPRRVVFVVHEDSPARRPLQALALAC